MKLDAYELEVLSAFESGKLRSVATKAELAKYREAARATAIKDRRVNIRLSSGDLAAIQARALEEGMPYQTLIASVLHKYVTGRLVEPARMTPAPPPERPPSTAGRRDHGPSRSRGQGARPPQAP
jgi:predicted DNA binding CopG/RHH family protein